MESLFGQLPLGSEFRFVGGERSFTKTREGVAYTTDGTAKVDVRPDTLIVIEPPVPNGGHTDGCVCPVCVQVAGDEVVHICGGECAAPICPYAADPGLAEFDADFGAQYGGEVEPEEEPIEGEPAEPKPTDPCYVNVYLIDRAFGGREEGGWYYDCGVIQRVYPTTYEHADELARRMRESDEFSNEDRPEISSVLSRGRYDVRIETQPGENYPAYRPRYE
jgi:hypothetical protein